MKFASLPAAISRADSIGSSLMNTEHASRRIMSSCRRSPPDGKVLRRRIRNAETGKTQTVSTWAERVPQAVYERIQSDKQSDGVLDETLFAVKKPGEPDLEVVLKGESNEPVQRTSQITKW